MAASFKLLHSLYKSTRWFSFHTQCDDSELICKRLKRSFMAEHLFIQLVKHRSINKSGYGKQKSIATTKNESAAS
jgi:hypothetical protein